VSGIALFRENRTLVFSRPADSSNEISGLRSFHNSIALDKGRKLSAVDDTDTKCKAGQRRTGPFPVRAIMATPLRDVAFLSSMAHLDPRETPGALCR
jgi:hypothetical protein